MKHDETIRQLLLEGKTKAEILDRLSYLNPSTVRVYISQAMKGLSPDEQAKIKTTQRALSTYHQRFPERRVLSALHVRIGIKLLSAREVSGMNLSAFAKHHDFSNRIGLSTMEQGFHDFTLSEIQKIAGILNMNVDEILCPPEIKMKS